MSIVINFLLFLANAEYFNRVAHTTVSFSYLKLISIFDCFNATIYISRAKVHLLVHIQSSKIISTFELLSSN